VLRFGSGITPGEISLSVAAGGALVATIGTGGDSVTIDGFNPTDPVASMPIQQFQFDGGTTLSFAQLLNQVAASAGDVTNPDGSITYYNFTPGQDQVYDGQTYPAGSQAGQEFLIDADGTIREYTRDGQGRLASTEHTFTDGTIGHTTFSYNTDGSYKETEVYTQAGGGGTTTIVSYVDANGNVTEKDVTNPDGSTSVETYDLQGRRLTGNSTAADGSTAHSTFLYNVDGSYEETEVDTPAGGGATTTIVSSIDTNGNLTEQSVTNPGGSTEVETFDLQGRRLTDNRTAADGATADSTFLYNTGGSYQETELDTPAGGGATTTIVSSVDTNGNVTEQTVTNPDGSTEVQTFDAQGRHVTDDLTATDGSTRDITFLFNADGSYKETEVDTPAGGGATTTIVSSVDSNGNVTEQIVTNPDGSTEVQTFDAQGRHLTDNLAATDGSTRDLTFVFNADGSYKETDVDTPAGSGATTTVSYIDASGNLTEQDATNPDGSTDNSSFTYNADGSSGQLETITPAGGGSSTIIATDYDSQSRWVERDVTRSDGSTDDSSIVYHPDGSLTRTERETDGSGGGTTTFVMNFNTQIQLMSQNETDPDGTTRDSTFSYNADGSYVETTLITPSDGGAATTQVSEYDTSGARVSENSLTPQSGGSYLDTWEKSDGSNGNYWWNASTLEYHAGWYNSDGSYSADDYQYGTGGSPGSSGVSFTETYSDNNGDQGTRQFDASTGITSLSWYSSSTGTLTGTTSDSGFIGLQNDGELTNSQHDPSFFNPTVNPAFQDFLAGH
jgi:YD repeat-containing protein